MSKTHANVKIDFDRKLKTVTDGRFLCATEGQERRDMQEQTQHTRDYYLCTHGY